MEVRVSGNAPFDRCLRAKPRRAFRLDLSEASHITVYGLVAMSCCALLAEAEGLGYEFAPPGDPGVSNFLARMGFARLLADRGCPCPLPITSSTEQREVALELSTLNDSGGLTQLEDLMRRRLEQKAPPQSLQALLEALWELGDNAIKHSEATGVVAAAVYGAGRRTERVDLAIGDAGIGIREALLRSGKYSPESDHRAIELALQYHVTSTDDPQRGIGLSTTLEQTVNLRGSMVVRTGSASRLIVSPLRRGRGPEPIARNDSVPGLGGTIVALSIPCR